MSFTQQRYPQRYLNRKFFQLSYILLLVFNYIVKVNAAAKQIYPMDVYDASSINRIFIFATDQPLTRIIKNNTAIHPYLSNAVQLFREITTLMDKRKENDSPLACNLFGDPWINASRNALAVRQIGLFPENEVCATRIDVGQAVHSKELSVTFRSTAKQVITKARHSLFKALSELPQLQKIKNRPDLYWNNGYHEVKDWHLGRDGQTCELDRMSMYHVNESFYFIPEITNNPVDAVVSISRRQQVMEFVKEDFSQPLKLTLPMYDTVTKYGKGGEVVEGTTMISRWEGKSPLATVGAMNFETNPALQEAYRKGIVAIDIASDSVTSSNIAILLIPLIMSLMPVVFITELSTFGMFVYIIFTDIFSAIPFLIKGMELIHTSKRNDEMVAYRSGDMKLGQTEIWIASCHGEKNLRTKGIIFVAIALLAIIVGITMEVVANNYLIRRRKLSQQDYYGPFGFRPFIFIDTKSPNISESEIYEREYECEKQRRYSEEKELFKQMHNDDEEQSGGWSRWLPAPSRQGHVAM